MTTTRIFSNATRRDVRNPGKPYSATPVIEAEAYEASTRRMRELAGQVRATLPLPTAITRLQINPEAGAIQFTWCARQLVLTPMLQVFELKGTTLYLTEVSILIQALIERHALQNQSAPNS